VRRRMGTRAGHREQGPIVPAPADSATSSRASDGGATAGLSAGLAVIAAVLVGLRGLIGIRDPYTYDEAVTIAWFVKAPTAVDSITRQAVFNNHPLISLLDHLVYSLTGNYSPQVMRIIPLLALSASVALLGYGAARRWGLWQGALAAALLATNPLVLGEGRLVRGYGLLLLCAEVSAALLIRMSELEEPPRWMQAAYLVIVALGVLAHLYMLLVVAVELVFIWRTQVLRRPRLITAMGAGIAIGLSVQLPLLAAGSPGEAGRSFQPMFFGLLARALLGHEWLAVILAISLAGSATLQWRKDQPVLWLAAAVALELLAVWLIAPTNLYARFFVWLAPVAVLALIVGARRWQRQLPRPWSIAGWLACCVIVATQAHSPLVYSETNNASTRTASVLLTIQARGGEVCLVRGSWPMVAPYLSASIVGPDVPEKCDVVASLDEGLDQPYLTTIRDRYHQQVVIPAGSPATLFTNQAPECVSDTPPHECWTR
jgi:4-amino-4-deoxy-L-arabinose transferase-like glycosyltransferase